MTLFRYFEKQKGFSERGRKLIFGARKERSFIGVIIQDAELFFNLRILSYQMLGMQEPILRDKILSLWKWI